MKKTLFEEMDGTYIRHGDYFIPCLTLKEEEKRFIGVWGQRYLWYLKEYRRDIYMNLLASGKLNEYLADIEEQAQGITEQLKAENALEWIGRMSNMQVCAREIVDKDIIYA